jgi:hypothetical protein
MGNGNQTKNPRRQKTTPRVIFPTPVSHLPFDLPFPASLRDCSARIRVGKHTHILLHTYTPCTPITFNSLIKMQITIITLFTILAAILTTVTVNAAPTNMGNSLARGVRVGGGKMRQVVHSFQGPGLGSTLAHSAVGGVGSGAGLSLGMGLTDWMTGRNKVAAPAPAASAPAASAGLPPNVLVLRPGQVVIMPDGTSFAVPSTAA